MCAFTHYSWISFIFCPVLRRPSFLVPQKLTKRNMNFSVLSSFMNSSSKVAKLTVMRIGTHSGSFHADEALACFMLRQLPEYREAEIVRSRDPTVWKTCDILVDVGGEFDPKTHRYDHHQRSFEETMKSLGILPRFDTKLSSAGLVYAFFGREVIKAILTNSGGEKSSDKSNGAAALEPKTLQVLYEKMYEKFMEEIDAVDNGINATEETMKYAVTTTLSARVGYLNPPWNSKSPRSLDECFTDAMALTGLEFSDRLKYYYSAWLPARNLVEEAIQKRSSIHESGQILCFDTFLPWKDHLFTLEKELNLPDQHLKYVLYPDESGKWRIQCIPVGPLQGFDSRLPLPEAWRGVRDADLSQATGIDGCIFVHASGFIGGNVTRDGVMEMAKLSLENGKK